ncbi:MAG TPA: hypothetical protein VKT77_22455 [Chthonomonadaceae bacterium]|nr:hypothetical protein [Chthonomonadaceae bacterium]
MFIETRRNIVSVSGSLRGDQWPVLRTSAYLAYECHPLGIVIDFSGVSRVVAGGEATLASALEEIDRQRLPFVLLNFPTFAQSLMAPELCRRLAAGSERWWNRLSGAI